MGKKIKSLFIIILILISVGCSNNSKKEEKNLKNYIEKEDEKIIIYTKDIIDDDNGYGTYIYPTKETFKKGDFDLLSFMITETKYTYNFYIMIKNDFKNEWLMPLGWDVQMFDIYLNCGENKHKQTIAGRNVKMNEGWDNAILIAPEIQSKMIIELAKSNNVKDDISQAEALEKSVILAENVNISENILIAKLDKKLLPNMKNLKGYQVFVLGSDGYAMQNHTFSRLVIEKEDVWKFGGGTNYHGNPNVIDILGKNEKLSNYISTKDRIEFTSIDLIKK